MKTRFEWDPIKAAVNLRKHRVSFQTAVRAFSDPLALTWLDRIESGEERWQTLGAVGGVSLLLVVHTGRDEDEGSDEEADQAHRVNDGEEPVEVIRIISARRADRKERRRYERESRHL